LSDKLSCLSAYPLLIDTDFAQVWGLVRVGLVNGNQMM